MRMRGDYSSSLQQSLVAAERKMLQKAKKNAWSKVE